jgi:hypothetical protein
MCLEKRNNSELLKKSVPAGRSGDDAVAGIRTVLGIAWLPNSSVFDLFREFAPPLQITSSTGFGGRYCF